MKCSRIIMLLVVVVLLAMSGCGEDSGGGLNLNGSLTIATQSADKGTYMEVTFTTTYTNPQKSDLLGFPIHFTTSAGTYTMNTNNSGTIIQTFLIAKSSTQRFFNFAASSGDLVASTNVSIPAATVTPLAISPNPLTITTFANASTALGRNYKGQSFIAQITNGIAPYAAVVSPSPNPDISASITGNILTVTKTSSASGSATVVVTDSSNPQMIGTLTVNF